MKRFIFFLLMLAAIGVSSYVVFFNVGYVVEGTNTQQGFQIVENMFNDLMAGDVSLKLSTFDFVVYGLIAFFVINVAILFTMVIMFIMNFGMLNRIFKFYSIATWFFVSALLFTVPFGINFYNLNRAGHIIPVPFPMIVIVPIVASLILFVMGFIFKKQDSKAATL